MNVGEYLILMIIASFVMFFIDKKIAKIIIKKFGVIKILNRVGFMYLGMGIGACIVFITIITHVLDFLGIYVMVIVFGILIGLPAQIYGIQQND